MATAKNNRQTGRLAASEAARLLSDPKTPKNVRKVAASDLSQARRRSGK